MRLNLKGAIGLSTEHWTWLAETGKMKWDWPGWKQCGRIRSSCFLCEYAYGRDGCGSCPYWQKFKFCTRSNSPYYRWERARLVGTKKKYAKLFLEQLKQLEGGK